MYSAATVTLILSLLAFVLADEEKAIPVSDSSEGTRCDKDMTVAETCFKCSRLPGDIAVQLTDCCIGDDAFNLCDICVKMPGACLMDAQSVSDDAWNYGIHNFENTKDSDENYAQPKEDDKRFGTTFMGSSRLGYPQKRYGMLFMGGRRRGKGHNSFPFGKRWGTLNLGSKNNRMRYRYGSMYKREGVADSDSADDVMDKRFGTLFLSRGSGRRGGKRYGSLFMGGKGRQRIWK